MFQGAFKKALGCFSGYMHLNIWHTNSKPQTTTTHLEKVFTDSPSKAKNGTKIRCNVVYEVGVALLIVQPNPCHGQPITKQNVLGYVRADKCI